MKGGLRYLCGWLFASFLILTGFLNKAKRKSLDGEFILSIYMHNPSKKEFETYVKWLLKNGFSILSVPELEEIIHHNLEFPKGAALITVDDGWASNKTNIVDIADKYKIPVTIFVTTSPVEEGVYWWTYILEAKNKGIKCPTVSWLKKTSNIVRLAEVNKVKTKITIDREVLTIDQVKFIAKSPFITIGSHTHTHPILTNCEDVQMYDELLSSKQRLESWLGYEITSFAYPNGDYGEREVKALRASGYSIAFNSNPEPLTHASFQNYYSLPRYGILEGASLEENICRMVGVWKPITTKFKKLFYSNGKSEIAAAPFKQTSEAVEQGSF